MDVDAPFYNDPKPQLEKKTQNSAEDNNCAYMGLWDYEVVEAFFLNSKTGHYLEVELSPHGQHLVLLLHGKKNIIQDRLPLKYDVEIGKTNTTYYYT